MCGLVGYAGQTPMPNGADALNVVRHRGPDSSGVYRDEQFWLGHVRLSILDPSPAASQPMTTEDGRFVITYNGEVYNFKELAKEFSLKLRSHSDTEVVLRAFAKLGPHLFEKLNGMFAFAIVDRGSRKLWLVRDRLGIKPLYYRLNVDELVFASEIKGIVAIGQKAANCDLSSLHEWLVYGNNLGERTLYQGIRKLLPGHYLQLDLTTFSHRVQEYWSPRQLAQLPQIYSPTAAVIEQTRFLLEQAVKRQLVSDVPVGVFLSGGVDSSAITAFAAKHYAGRIATYSAGFDFDGGVNELPKASEVARYYGTDHHEIRVSGIEVPDLVEKMVHHHDAPFADAANIPLYLLASKIKDEKKVVLQGDGGDEVFGGYRRYSTLSFLRVFQLLAKGARLINAIAPRTPNYYRRRRYLNALIPSERAMVMALLLTEEDRQSIPSMVFAAEWCREIERHDPFARYRECQRMFVGLDTIDQMAFVDSMIVLPDIFLEKVDRSTMAASVEARVPFLDNDLFDYCMRVPGRHRVRWGRKKWLLKKSLAGVIPNHILSSTKTGFGVPFGQWLRLVLKPQFFDELACFERTRPGVLDRRVISRFYDQHVSGQRDRSFLLWKLLNFLIWANHKNINFQL